MIEVKHAPGRPWSHGNEAIGSAAHKTRRWNGTVFDADGDLIALTFANTPEECAALARLIAAAPEMLDALKKVRTWLEGWASAESELALIEAAIAKAEPRS